MGRLNWRDDEMDDGSSSGEVDEARRAVAVDDVVGEEAPAGQRLWRPGISNGEKEAMGGGNHDLGTRLSKI